MKPNRLAFFPSFCLLLLFEVSMFAQTDAAVNFAPVIPYGSGENAPGQVAIADLNGDAKLDLAVKNCDHTVGVLLGNGNGTFETVAVFGSGGAHPLSVAAEM